MSITCGIDWAEAHHDVALVDAGGTTVAKLRIDTGLPGFTSLMALIAEHSDEPSEVVVAIETDKNLVVAALQAAGFTVYAINPRAVARYRERSAQAGGKSDPGDAIVLANILRTDLAVHRRLPRISEGGLAVKALARQHQEAIWARQLTVNRLRSVLLEFYPNAIKAFPVLTHKAAIEVLASAPSPAHGLKLTQKRVVALLRRSGRGDRPGLAEGILAHLHEPALRQRPAVEAALSKAVVGLVRWSRRWSRPSPTSRWPWPPSSISTTPPRCCAGRPGSGPSSRHESLARWVTTPRGSRRRAVFVHSPGPLRSRGLRADRRASGPAM